MLFNLFSGNNDVLCIDVGFRNIKVVEVSNKEGSGIRVKKFAICKTPHNAISNGSIRYADKVAESLKSLISVEKMKAGSAKIIMSGTNIITQIFIVDKEINRDLNTTIMRAVNYHLPFVGNDYKVEYKILDSFKKDNREMCRVFVTAVPLVVIRSYVEVLQRLKLKPLSIDIPSNSTAKLFSKAKGLSGGNEGSSSGAAVNDSITAVIDFGSETTIFNVLEKGILTFNKVILSGSSNIDEQLSKDLGVGLEEAERLKMEYGLTVPDIKSSKDHNNVHKTIKSHIEGYIKKISNCIEAYTRDHKDSKITCVYITGGGSQLKGFEEFLGDSLQIPVYPIYALDLQGIEIDQSIEKNKMIFMANSLGISL